MPFDSSKVSPHWRAALLALAVLLIVVGPFALLRMAEQRTREAEALVAHTLEVETHLQRVSAAVRNIEAATLERALGATAPVLEERLDYSRTTVFPSLDRIERLTRESPGQQVRIGTLRQSISQRLDQIGRLVAVDGSIDSDELDRLAEHFPVQAPIAEMVAAERTALEERAAVADRTRRQANWLAIGSLAAQILQQQ